MDFVGVGMCMMTLPMALFTLMSALAGATLVVMGRGDVVLLGCAVAAACLPLAMGLERLIVATDEAAIRCSNRGQRPLATLIAVVSGGLPMIVILGWEYLIYRHFVAEVGGAPKLLLWLWSYAVATGPWTLFALRVSRFRRTLCGIRAYAGHIAYWFLAIGMLAFDLAPVPTLAAMLLPAVLPFTVGLLLALADRDALTNVRV